MMKKRMEDMIHEALEGGGGITQAKGHDQKLIVALMSSKGSLGNVYPLSYISGGSQNKDQV
jgi:hypothetical protein